MAQLIEKVVTQIIQNHESIKCEESGEIYDLEKFYSGYAQYLNENPIDDQKDMYQILILAILEGFDVKKQVLSPHLKSFLSDL